MARKLPDILSRRHLLEKDLAPAQALATAEAYMEAGRPVEAIDFFAKANAGDRLAALRAEAVAAGDPFLLRSVARALRQAPRHDEWVALAAAAEAAGKELYAADARRQAGREEG